MVCAAVYRERALKTVTNYFIVSLAIADIMVGILVMPLAIYVEVSRDVITHVTRFILFCCWFVAACSKRLVPGVCKHQGLFSHRTPQALCPSGPSIQNT